MTSSRITGTASLLRTLDQLTPEARQALAEELRASGPILLAHARAETPVRTGGLRGALAYRVTGEGKDLTLELGLIDKGNQKKFFYGYILDAGHKKKTVITRRGGGAAYLLHVPALDKNKYNFVFGRPRDFRQTQLPRFRKALYDVIDRANAGGPGA